MPPLVPLVPLVPPEVPDVPLVPPLVPDVPDVPLAPLVPPEDPTTLHDPVPSWLHEQPPPAQLVTLHEPLPLQLMVQPPCGHARLQEPLPTHSSAQPFPLHVVSQEPLLEQVHGCPGVQVVEVASLPVVDEQAAVSPTMVESEMKSVMAKRMGSPSSRLSTHAPCRAHVSLDPLEFRPLVRAIASSPTRSPVGSTEAASPQTRPPRPTSSRERASRAWPARRAWAARAGSSSRCRCRR